MIKYNRLYSCLIILFLLAQLCSCSAVPRQGIPDTNVRQTEPAMADPEPSDSSLPGQNHNNHFTDSAGRVIDLPQSLDQIAPSGSLAQVMLFTLCPEKLCGRASDFSLDAASCLGPSYTELPLFGQFYGKNASLNMEALLKASPDVIIDIGQYKKTIVEDMDGLQNQLGIPVVFVEATLPTLSKAYLTLGELTGEVEQSRKLSSYCQDVLDQAKDIRNQIEPENRRSIYFATGSDGLHTNAKGSIHADVIEETGALNVADLGTMNQGGGTAISFEQLLLWQPDIIIADTEQLYKHLTTDPLWQQLHAIETKQVYRIPSAPFGFMGSPPSANRLIGIQWLGHIVYPEYYTEDIRSQVTEFFDLFYHFSPTDSQMDDILKYAL